MTGLTSTGGTGSPCDEDLVKIEIVIAGRMCPVEPKLTFAYELDPARLAALFAGCSAIEDLG